MAIIGHWLNLTTSIKGFSRIFEVSAFDLAGEAPLELTLRVWNALELYVAKLMVLLQNCL